MTIGGAGRLRFGPEGRQIPVAVFADPDALGRVLAAEILAGVQQASIEGRSYLLGCPAGRSLQSTYRALAELAASQEADLSRLVVAMMDEYLIPTPEGPRLCPAEAHYSCRGYGLREILDAVNEGLPPLRRIPVENLWHPEPGNPGAYEERLRARGGIDLFLLASGKSDGHVAFNPAGSALSEPTRVIRLSDTTRRDNLETFTGFRSLEQVPELGVSVGLATVVEQSRRVVLVMTGGERRAAVQRLRDCAGFDPDWPASVIYVCPNPTILVDHAALPPADC